MNRRRNLHRFPFFRRHRFFTISFVQEWCHCASGGGGSKGVLSDVGVGSGDDDDSNVFLMLMRCLLELLSQLFDK